MSRTPSYMINQQGKKYFDLPLAASEPPVDSQSTASQEILTRMKTINSINMKKIKKD